MKSKILKKINKNESKITKPKEQNDEDKYFLQRN